MSGTKRPVTNGTIHPSHLTPVLCIPVKNKKLQNLDEDFIKDLAGDTEEEAKAKQEAEAAKARKAKAKLEQRLAIEQKKLRQMNGEKKKKKKKGADNDDEDEALEMFIKKKTK